MNFKYYIVLLACCSLFACKKIIDVVPQSNLNVATFYSNTVEAQAALAGCYNGMQLPVITEWEFTELRSDNTKQGVPASTSSTNRDLSDLDEFIPNTSNQGIYNYWFATYNNIRNVNTLLQKIGVSYDPAAGTIKFNDNPVKGMTETDRKQIAGEAMFIRAYHYFNLVRLFGGVFLVYQPISPNQATTINRSPVADIYKLIQADLTTSAASVENKTYAQQSSANRGRATKWAANGLLAKVYLTQNRKSDAIPLLQDIISNSGYNVLPGYASVFSITNEMNSEILFAIRFKAGGLGLGSPFGNDFGPLGTGALVINGDGDGLNYPTSEIDTLTNGDLRKPTLIGSFTQGNLVKLYIKKYLNPVVIKDDGEADWPVLRFPDIQMLLAEAQGYSQASLDLINAVRPRAGEALLTLASVPNVASFEAALSRERRIEFAFENQRWFDLVRYSTTLTTINAVQRLKDHFAYEYFAHYRLYVSPTPTLAELQGYVTQDRLLLPIPQREIDTNTQIVIAQNPGY